MIFAFANNIYFYHVKGSSLLVQFPEYTLCEPTEAWIGYEYVRNHKHWQDLIQDLQKEGPLKCQNWAEIDWYSSKIGCICMI